jgi:hypothetical protein
MSVQVINSAGNVLWTTDKAEIESTGNNVTYQVFVTGLGTAAPVGNLYADAVAVPADTVKQIYVGAGNYLIMTGSNFTARALGTQSSAQYSVFNSSGV